MKKKYLLFIILASFILIISFYLLNKKPIQKPIDCFDCGPTGWQKMDQKCNQIINTKNDFKNCLINFSWSQVNQNTNIEEFKEGFLEINGSGILKTPTSSSIKALFYHQWAVDKEGSLYLLSQAG